MSDTWLNVAMGLNTAILLFMLQRLFSLSSKIVTNKVEIFKELQNHQTKMSELFEKQINEGILCHKRVDALDRLVSATTDKEFYSSKNIASGAEELPTTNIIRKVIRTNG